MDNNQTNIEQADEIAGYLTRSISPDMERIMQFMTI